MAPSIPSKDCDLHFLDPSNNDTVLEVYTLPRDVWFKEIEDVKARISQSEESKHNNPPTASDEASGAVEGNVS